MGVSVPVLLEGMDFGESGLLEGMALRLAEEQAEVNG
jgi:hypothetical protein